jgi:hypothetical protein
MKFSRLKIARTSWNVIFGSLGFKAKKNNWLSAFLQFLEILIQIQHQILNKVETCMTIILILILTI